MVSANNFQLAMVVFALPLQKVDLLQELALVMFQLSHLSCFLYIYILIPIVDASVTDMPKPFRRLHSLFLASTLSCVRRARESKTEQQNRLAL